MRLVHTCFASLGLALALLAAPLPAAAQLACGDVLGPGGSYTLTSDLACPITALTVIGPAKLDLGGHRIGCTAGGVTALSLLGRGVTLRNGWIDACATGVAVGGQGQHKLASLVVGNLSATAIAVASPNNRFEDLSIADAVIGFDLDGSKQQIDRCTITGVQSYGVLTYSADSGHRIRDAVAHATGFGGAPAFRIRSPGSQLERVRVSGGGISAIYASADDVRLKDALTTGGAIIVVGARARVDGARSVGVSDRAIDITCSDCSLKNLFAQDSLYGIHIDGTNVAVTNAMGNYNAFYGIDTAAGAANVRIKSSRAHGNSVADAFTGAAACGTNVWKSNSFGTTNDACIR